MSYWKTRGMALFDCKTVPSTSRKTENAIFERATVSKPQRMRDGFIWADGMILPRPCTIRDMSMLEAEIALWHDDIKPSLLSGPLKLYSCADQQEVDCTVASRDGVNLGLRFTSNFRVPSRRYS